LVAASEYHHQFVPARDRSSQQIATANISVAILIGRLRADELGWGNVSKPFCRLFAAFTDTIADAAADARARERITTGNGDRLRLRTNDRTRLRVIRVLSAVSSDETE
jgi:hypothetical protein